MEVPKREPDQLSMNSDHTHFIIIREQPIGMNSKTSSERKSSITDSEEKRLEKLTDSAQSATNRFRDRFEAFLHRETLQSTTQITSPSVASLPTERNGMKRNFY